MSSTALKRAALTLGVLVLLWGIFAVARRGGADSAGGPDIAPPDSATVDRVSVIGPEDTVLLIRGTDGSWTVNGHAADAARVGEWFAAVHDAAAGGELVAQSASSHARLGVTDASGRRVLFASDADTLFEAIAGNTGRVMGSGYLRLPGSDEVYQVRGQLVSLSRRSVNDWRDKRIAQLPADSIDRIEVERRGERYTVLRGDEGGWIVRDRAADSATVARLIGALENLEAAGFPTTTQLDSISFAQPYRRLRVADRNDQTLLAMVFDSTATGAWVRREMGGPVYRLDRWRVDGLTPPDSTVYAR